jgi:5-methylcytosine-specific restriction endonuclease McrA
MKVDADPHDVQYEFSGYGPLAGDVVEREGSATFYYLISEDERPLDVPAPHGIYVAEHILTGHKQLWAATQTGERSRLGIAQLTSNNEILPFYERWTHRGIRYKWSHEVINDVTPDSVEYQWQAVVAIAEDAGHINRQETPEFRRFADARARATAATNRHARRIRVAAATVERFDPYDVYERDNWICQLCRAAIDPAKTWPDLQYRSLDHIIPLAAGGEHSKSNTQAAHWICNVAKGARMTA